MKHVATVEWRRPAGAAFTDQRYPRAHRWRFDGGAEVPASSSPHVVPPPFSDAAAVDPEEAFVAALASCHMLWFLSIAAGRGHVVERYVDAAEGTMVRNAEGRLAMTAVTLRPCVAFAAPVPAEAEQRAMHEQAHHECFLAASVRSDMRCEPVFEEAAGGDAASRGGSAP
jgi:organic hydroperoxide reductase OsmC/OhrA